LGHGPSSCLSSVAAVVECGECGGCGNLANLHTTELGSGREDYESKEVMM